MLNFKNRVLKKIESLYLYLCLIILKTFKVKLVRNLSFFFTFFDVYVHMYFSNINHVFLNSWCVFIFKICPILFENWKLTKLWILLGVPCMSTIPCQFLLDSNDKIATCQKMVGNLAKWLDWFVVRSLAKINW